MKIYVLEESPNTSMVTLKDIAEQLGISISTASRALKDNPRISSFTKEKVRRAAKEMGYVSTEFLHQQLRDPSNLIGVIVPKVSYHLYAMAISGIERIAEEHGMHIIVCQSNESYEREKSLVDKMINIGVNGVIVSIASETKSFSHFERLKHNGIPLVFFNRECSEVVTHKVSIDNKRAAYEAVKHLIAIGCQKIAYLGGPEGLQISRDRADGYRKALKEAGMWVDTDMMVYSKFDKESVLSAARRLLYAPDYPDGILTFSDQISINVMLVCKERGISIPDQLSLIGFNNEPVTDLLEPSLTSIDQPGYTMGEEAAKLLLQPSADFKTSYEKRTLKSHMVIRNSTNKNKPK